MNKKFSASRSGFTLIEMIVVIGILAVVVTAGLTSYKNTQTRAIDSKKRTDLEKLRSALELYRGDNSQYPAVTAGSTTIYLLLPLTQPVAYLTVANFPADPVTLHYYYYQQNPSGGGVNTYRLCAHLDGVLNANDPVCPGPGTPSCGMNAPVTNCNYGLSQP
jgi:prepilin-type N-terminal cleavage/methylation domain-containing protein